MEGEMNGQFQRYLQRYAKQNKTSSLPSHVFSELESHVEGVGMVVDKGRCTAWSNTMLKALKRES